jgi:hypothetical protein
LPGGDGFIAKENSMEILESDDREGKQDQTRQEDHKHDSKKVEEIEGETRDTPEETKRVEQATFDPEAVVQHEGDYKQAEAIQAAFVKVIEEPDFPPPPAPVELKPHNTDTSSDESNTELVASLLQERDKVQERQQADRKKDQPYPPADTSDSSGSSDTEAGERVIVTDNSQLNQISAADNINGQTETIQGAVDGIEAANPELEKLLDELQAESTEGLDKVEADSSIRGEADSASDLHVRIAEASEMEFPLGSDAQQLNSREVQTLSSLTRSRADSENPIIDNIRGDGDTTGEVESGRGITVGDVTSDSTSSLTGSVLTLEEALSASSTLESISEAPGGEPGRTQNARETNLAADAGTGVMPTDGERINEIYPSNKMDTGHAPDLHVPVDGTTPTITGVVNDAHASAMEARRRDAVAAAQARALEAAAAAAEARAQAAADAAAEAEAQAAAAAEEDDGLGASSAANDGSARASNDLDIASSTSDGENYESQSSGGDTSRSAA